MSRTDTIISMARSGIRPQEIAARICVKPEQVHNTLSKARRAGIAVPRFIGLGTRTGHRHITMEPRVIEKLGRQAKLRGVTARELAARILTICAEQNLVAAVLDDGACNGR